MAKIGIDFGTTNTTVSYVDANGEARPGLSGKIPSALYFFPDKDVIFYGEDAMTYGKDFPDGTLIKDLKRGMKERAVRNLNGKSWTYADLIGSFFKYLKTKTESEVFKGEEITDVCITHPVEFSSEKVRILKQAAQKAGFTNIRLMHEPVAAAMGYMNALTKREGYIFNPETLLIFDFGGGTLDLAVVDTSEGNARIPLKSMGDDNCGGENIDRSLYNLFDKEHYAKNGSHISAMEGKIDLHSLRFACESNKRALVGSLKPDLTTVMPVMGATKSGKRISMTVNYATWNEEVIAPTINKAMAHVDEMLSKVKDAGKKIDKVILIGGSSIIPEVRMELERRNLNCDWIDGVRDMAVANGAALAATFPIVPVRCYCTKCGKGLKTNDLRCPDCLQENFMYDHKFDAAQ